ncbi:hypothetical protein H1S01_06280 [Heliobacterium chlorum]|uniref:Uncharacterized protein n=1 Tax=Heliobacterium chlorum TaxID=2698 RepID=A0ABR7T1W5_HELCL|nr:hypothetical protein [Heliobacterium chlorum]MBC9784117.1 hypothetical protein [Heliobacterium chlorum]
MNPETKLPHRWMVVLFTLFISISLNVYHFSQPASTVKTDSTDHSGQTLRDLYMLDVLLEHLQETLQSYGQSEAALTSEACVRAYSLGAARSFPSPVLNSLLAQDDEMIRDDLCQVRNRFSQSISHLLDHLSSSPAPQTIQSAQALALSVETQKKQLEDYIFGANSPKDARAARDAAKNVMLVLSADFEAVVPSAQR